MQSTRRQKEAKVIASLYDDDGDSNLNAPVVKSRYPGSKPRKTDELASFKSRMKKADTKPSAATVAAIDDEEEADDTGVVIKQRSKPRLGFRKSIKPLKAEYVDSFIISQHRSNIPAFLMWSSLTSLTLSIQPII